MVKLRFRVNKHKTAYKEEVKKTSELQELIEKLRLRVHKHKNNFKLETLKNSEIKEQFEKEKF